MHTSCCWVYIYIIFVYFWFVVFLPWNFQFEQLRIADLKVVAQKSLNQIFLRLIAPDGHVLDPQQPLEDEGLREGDTCFGSALEFSVSWFCKCELLEKTCK